MADDRHYVPGSWYLLCMRSGFKVRAGRVKKEWDNLQVRTDSWEPRQPQDFVKGVRDDQTVPFANPRPVDNFQGPLGTQLSASSPAGSQLVYVESTVRMFVGDQISIMLDTGVTFVTKIEDVISQSELQITPVLPWSASSGNVVIDLTAISDPIISYPGPAQGPPG